jgi:hypothetical protein
MRAEGLTELSMWSREVGDGYAFDEPDILGGIPVDRD